MGRMSAGVPRRCVPARPASRARRGLATLVAGGWLAAAAAATPPYVQLEGAIGSAAIAPGTCAPTGPTPALLANIDLGASGTYRYSPAFVIPNFFDDEGEFNLVYNQDATLFVSPYLRIPGVRADAPFPVAALPDWFAGQGTMPDHTVLALRVAAYDSDGRSVATSRITWDCTTGVVTSLEHRGNAAGAVPPTARLIEFHHATLDHYFVSADPAEIGLLDTGTLAGWRRTGQDMAVFTGDVPGTQPVCRYYLPPAYGDSHFYSASPAECAEVGARFPGFVLEAAAVFHVGMPDAGTGACAAGMVPVFRLWNQRVDSNHRYTTDPATKVQMIAQGYVAEGYGPEAVAMCALP